MVSFKDLCIFQAKYGKDGEDYKPPPDYPTWICGECAMRVEAKWPAGHIATFHNGTCDVCCRKAGVTQLRDWGYPEVKKGQFKKKSMK